MTVVTFKRACWRDAALQPVAVSTLSPEPVHKQRPNRRLQRDKLWEAKTRCELQVVWKKGVLRYFANLLNDGFVVLHRANACQQLCGDTKVKVSSNRACQSKGCFPVAPDFGYFQKARGRTCDGSRNSGQEMAQRAYRSQALVKQRHLVGELTIKLWCLAHDP